MSMYTYTAGSPRTFGALGAPRPIDVMGPGYGSYLQEGHPMSYAPRFGEESGGGWAEVLSTAIEGTASIYQLSTQAKLAKQARHQREREAAHQRELEKTQALYLASGSIKPAQGNVVTVANGGGFGAGRMLAIAGVAAAGVGLLWYMRQSR